jgi:4-methylaminobutanoate oxidase (formaldehyde-forming)
MFPLVDLDGVLGAAWLSSDGYLDPSSLCTSLAAQARALGVQVHTRTRVLGIERAPRTGEVTSVRTDRGEIACEVIVDCGGMFAAQIARMVGVRVPVVPMSHQYLVTDAFLPGLLGRRDAPLPTLRDPDLLVYWRQEVDGLLMGGYERDPAPWTASTTSYDDVPAEFNGRLLPADWARLEEITANSAVRVPAMADAPIRTLINGPEAFTPDNEFCLGPTEVPGFFVAAGFCAHGIAGAGGIGRVMAEWILDGDPGMDLWHMDVRRFGQAYRSPSYTLARTLENYRTYYDIRYPGQEREAGRPLRTSPVYAWHAQHGASFGEKSGWERVNHYGHNASGDDAAEESLRPQGWAGRMWSPATAVEHRATRERAGLYDETSFAKLAVAGPDAARLLERCCDNVVARDLGAVTYTQMLNHRGGIEADVTVTRLAEEAFLVVTGTAFGGHDLAWLRTQARTLHAAVSLSDVTGQYVTFALWGPRARDILTRCTPADLSDEAFPFMTAQELTVGDVPVRALRVTFVGELGWELYASAEYGQALWRTLWEAGRPDGLTACGYRAIDSLRLEKGYRVWSTDITPETTPYEAGLGFCVKLDHPAKSEGFIGDDALRAAKAVGASRKLACITLDDPRRVVLGSEPVRLHGTSRMLGRVTSGGFGYTVDRSIAYAYLPVEHAGEGTAVELDLFGDWVAGVVARVPLYDPKGARLR